MRRMPGQRIFAPIILLCLAASLSFGQTIVTGALSGTVSDPSGGSVAGANLTLKSLATGETITATTSGAERLHLAKPWRTLPEHERALFRRDHLYADPADLALRGVCGRCWCAHLC
jgi:hypothetical protein